MVTGARPVLIFSADALTAALIGAAVELSGFAPVFPAGDETPRDALLRVRPGIALVDCDHEQACTETFFGPALMARARVVIFSSSRSNRALEPIAEQFGVRLIRLPMAVDELARVLQELESPVRA
ncbi:MAG TPA: hypothetical protein VHB25_06605 [Gemmatimonadaceae bacterium]|nr:hypothetical protein [Gemmatimonadaceae bacterium]